MNMVRPQHKSAFVSPPSRDYSQPATASQSGSKWPKGPGREKKKHPNLCNTMVHANHSPRHLHPYHTSPPLPSLHRSGPSLVPPLLGRLKFRPYSHTHTEVSVKSAELHAFKLSLEKRKISFFFFFFRKDRRKTRVEWLTFLSESKSDLAAVS